jgi:hypothetical protein
LHRQEGTATNLKEILVQPSETLGGQLRAAVVADCQPVAADVQLAGNADRYPVAERVQEVELGVADGASDGYRLVWVVDPLGG